METEARVAEALLDKRLRVFLPAPLLLRIFGIRQIPLWYRRPVYAQLLRISRLYVRMNITPDKLQGGYEPHTLFADIARHGVTASRIIATGLIRSGWATTLFHRPLARYLRRHMTADQLAELMQLIAYLSGVENFVTIITSAAYMRVTMPTESQAQKKGS
jgi:hypothetical protein